MAGERILIVEDERIVARDIEKRLAKLGYTVVGSVAFGEEAIAKVADLSPDLILMDIQLKGQLDGIETAERLGSLYEVPIIYLTAYADEDTLQRAKVTEPFGYIVKPFDERDLHVAVEVALRRRLAEAAIRVALDKERQISDIQSRFWSMVIHEFRNPLTSILSAAQMLEIDDPKLTPERRAEYLTMIERAVRLMDSLMNDTLSIARTEHGQLTFNPQPQDVEQFCQNLVEEMQFGTGPTHQILFTSNGSCSEMSLDYQLLRHILANLISNAVKYSPAGSRVEFNLSCEGGEAVFQVSDSGIGIPKAEQAHLFEPFHRASNVGDISGTGLGMTLVKKCLDLHNGQIEVSSEVGQGTTITVKLYAVCAVRQAHYS
ncbi:hybrid sensor histidine kinase/response regulator [filamentous cyanobacterium CCP5]|nr:hybrid sensor histidine kinase/response regulator [filamentous cyanobacterium CCP5]